jgi:hypothetical protein
MTDINSEVYAVILARVAQRGQGQLEGILSELGVSAADFRRGEAAVLSELGNAWPKRAGKNAMKFATALARELEALGGLGVGGRSAPAIPGSPDLTAPLVEPEKAIPSFLQPAPLPASPIVALRPIISETQPDLPPVYRPPAHLAGTMDADLGAIVAAVERGALPFNAPTAAPVDTQPLPGAALPPAPPSAPQRVPAGLTGTMDAGVAFFAPATPFGPPPAPTPPPAPGEIDLAKYPLALYAAIAGELARGEPREKVLAANNLTEGLYDQVAHAWSARFQKEPQLQLHFNALARSSAGRGPRKG